MTDPCKHLKGASRPAANSEGCEECLQMGSRWVHLRLCLACGHVGCCDSSPNKHATAHFRTTGHPAVASLEPGEEWAFCYADDVFVDQL